MAAWHDTERKKERKTYTCKQQERPKKPKQERPTLQARATEAWHDAAQGAIRRVTGPTPVQCMLHTSQSAVLTQQLKQ